MLTSITASPIVYKATIMFKLFGVWVDVKAVIASNGLLAAPDGAKQTTEFVRQAVSNVDAGVREGADCKLSET